MAEPLPPAPPAAVHADEPFALLADGGRMLLFTRPEAVIAGRDMAAALAAMRRATEQGLWLAGGFSYESGLQLEPRLKNLSDDGAQHWFGCFRQAREIAAGDLAALVAQWRVPVADPDPQPLIAKADWLAMVTRAQDYIAAGDIYQVNLTFPLALWVDAAAPLASAAPLALFAQLFDQPAMPHGGIIHDGHGRWWLSFSPELFFRFDRGRITVRPMKGTAARGASLAEDVAAARFLASDPKNRAENLMITDLMRNDLGRIATIGGVTTSALFAVETYPSVHQLTSTVAASLAPGQDALTALAALFPSGSITGAPKIRAMEIIAELERQPRGIYCGSMGWIAPGAQQAQMNVAIRTIAIANGAARLGVGAGITAMSDAEEEWAECLIKSRFLRPARPSALIETMARDANGQIPRLQLHMERLQRSAQRFAIPFDWQAIEALLARHSGGAARLRLLLQRNGEITFEAAPLPARPEKPVAVALCPLPLAADDWRLFHKTADRTFHEEARQRTGAFECIYARPDGLLTEGSFTNLFVERDGVLLTPPAELGLLPGVLRAELLQQGRAKEAPLRRADLRGGFFLGNSLRGLFPARLAD